MELVENCRGNLNVIYKNYAFHRFKNHNKEITWLCCNKDCAVTMLTDINISTILSEEPIHNHQQPSTTQGNKRKTKQTTKGKKKKLPIKKKKKLIIKKSLSYKLPEDTKLTKTFSDKDTQLMWHNVLMEKSVARNKDATGKTAEGLYDSLHVTIPSREEVLQINRNRENMVYITTISNLQLLCESSSIRIDRTFPKCSRHFYQLITIYCSVSYQPFVHFLLPENQSSFYEMFQKLIEHCTYLGMRFQPTIIQSNLKDKDFFYMQKLYPTCIIQRTKYGATKYWWTKIQDLNLTHEFPDINSDLAKWLRWNFPMFYLTNTDVADSFLMDLKAQTTQVEIMDSYSYYLIDSMTSCKSSQDVEPSISNESLHN